MTALHTVTEKFPARTHASKLIKELVALLPEAERVGTHAVFLQGHPATCRDDTDRELPFHQEANFNYITGAHNVHSASVLVTFNLDNATSAVPEFQHTLFVPPADPLETMWSVAPPTLEVAAATFEPSVAHTTDLPSALSALEGVTVHTLPHTHEFPPLPTEVLAIAEIDTAKGERLRAAFHVARLTKTESEIALIRKANAITSGAHEVLMRELGRFAASRAKSASVEHKGERTGAEALMQWEVESEADAEALFVAACRRMGADQAYLPIVASGTNASTLHYVCNDRLFPSTATPRSPGDTSFVPRRLARGCCGDIPDHEHATPASALHAAAFEPQILLVDAGAEWQGYASDVTRTIPVGNGGKYTSRGKEIYELVLRMQKETEDMVRVGAHWDTLHLHAHKVLIEGFLQMGIFKGSAEEVLQSGLSAAFFPHGLGHSLGLDVHDSLQYLRTKHMDVPAETTATPEKLYTYLRIRQRLLPNMVLTVEPGCYFAPQLLDTHGVWESPLVDAEVLKTYLSVGGVRIEDVVVVREGSKCENLTTVGREVPWVEARCSGL